MEVEGLWRRQWSIKMVPLLPIPPMEKMEVLLAPFLSLFTKMRWQPSFWIRLMDHLLPPALARCRLRHKAFTYSIIIYHIDSIIYPIFEIQCLLVLLSILKRSSYYWKNIQLYSTQRIIFHSRNLRLTFFFVKTRVRKLLFFISWPVYAWKLLLT